MGEIVGAKGQDEEEKSRKFNQLTVLELETAELENSLQFKIGASKIQEL